MPKFDTYLYQNIKKEENSIGYDRRREERRVEERRGEERRGEERRGEERRGEERRGRGKMISITFFTSIYVSMYQSIKLYM